MTTIIGLPIKMLQKISVKYNTNNSCIIFHFTLDRKIVRSKTLYNPVFNETPVEKSKRRRNETVQEDYKILGKINQKREYCRGYTQENQAQYRAVAP
jgi:hypothetical protein